MVDLILAILLLFGAPPAATLVSDAQSQELPAIAHAYEYEVSSIKLSKSGDGDVGIHYTPDGLTATNVGLPLLLQLAFGVHEDQIIGLPKSISSETYEIQATIGESTIDGLKKLSPEQLRRARQQMLQSLLAERFRLTVHRDTKEIPIYSLVIANNGFKLRESAPNEIDLQGRKGMSISGSSGAMRGQLVSMAALAQFLSRTLDRNVLDKTGLTGRYDFTLKWTPNQNQFQLPPGFDATSATAPNEQAVTPASDSSAPDLFTAVQEQLGLKLKAEKSPVEVIVIDHLEKPSGN